MKISQQHRTNTHVQTQNIIPKLPPPPNNRNKLKKHTKWQWYRRPRAHNPDLVCDLATRQSHQLTNEHADLLTIVTVGVQEGNTV